MYHFFGTKRKLQVTLDEMIIRTASGTVMEQIKSFRYLVVILDESLLSLITWIILFRESICDWGINTHII